MRHDPTSVLCTDVWLDSDNLEDMTDMSGWGLFDVVRCKVDTVVVLLSKMVLTRPWCIGEITTAYVNGVTLVPLALPDCPSWAVVGADFWEEIAEALTSGTTCITQYGWRDGSEEGRGS